MVNCSLCGAEETRELHTKIRNSSNHKTRVYACAVCGVQFLHPRQSAEELEEYYGGEYRKEYEDQNFISDEEAAAYFEQFLPEAKTRVDRIRSYLKDTDNILEIGCSYGYFLQSVRHYTPSVSGTEWDENGLKYANKLGINVKKDITAFSEKFDKIFMFHVLEHIDDPISFLKDLHRYLKSDGILVIEVPNNQDILASKYDIKEFKDFYYCSAHLWYFNPNSLTYVLRKSGFECNIMPVQRYNLSNHMHWLKEKAPGGQGVYDDIFSDSLQLEYANMLKSNGLNDTLFAVCKKGGEVY